MEIRWTEELPESIIQRAMRSSLGELCAEAAEARDSAHGSLVTYSPKVFIPLTKLCRNVCHYCTFAETPRRGTAAYLSREEIVGIARQGVAAGCHEALFTLGDKPEARYNAAVDALRALGHASTISYLADMCGAVIKETGLLPHVNAGVLTSADFERLRPVSASMGLMLETVSPRLCEPGQVHYGSPDKDPAHRLETIRLAGVHKVPFTTGILIGIGETRLERIQSLVAIRNLHRQYGHIQEVIIQNFRAKADTRSADAEEPDLEEMLWTVAVARMVLGSGMSIQAPPNLSPGSYAQLVRAGLNDWGGVSPVTVDHVNPEAPWPSLDDLRRATALAGKVLTERLTVYPAYVEQRSDWIDTGLHQAVLRASDGVGLARADKWSPGLAVSRQVSNHLAGAVIGADLKALVSRANAGARLDTGEIARLFAVRGPEADYLFEAADDLRREKTGEMVRYVVNRNINYTNICSYRCRFCAFSKGKTHEALRGAAYDLDFEEIERRVREAWDRGATEVCMQGGIHPAYTGATYLDICRAVKRAAPEMHVHAFSPLEIQQGAATLKISVEEFLTELKRAGLGSLPGTAAEILDDNVRAIICPDKLKTQEWLDIIETAHHVGLYTTSTIMFGHVDGPLSWALHLLAIRDLQDKTGGFTEFVPLPFVPMEAPLYLHGKARKGPTLREALLMHAVARLVLNPLIPNIQASWVKMGVEGLKLCLDAGANDAGGTLMNESISRAAGTEHGQELPPVDMKKAIKSLGRTSAQRDTLYRPVSLERRQASIDAAPLSAAVQTPPGGSRSLASMARATTERLNMSRGDDK